MPLGQNLRTFLLAPSRRLRRHPPSLAKTGLAFLHLLSGLAVLTFLLFASEREAQAYADPGSGALIWQMLMAALVGAAFYFRRFTSWIKRRYEKPTNDPPSEDEGAQV